MFSKSSDARTGGLPRRLLVLGFALVAIGVAGCGKLLQLGDDVILERTRGDDLDVLRTDQERHPPGRTRG